MYSVLRIDTFSTLRLSESALMTDVDFHPDQVGIVVKRYLTSVCLSVNDVLLSLNECT